MAEVSVNRQESRAGDVTQTQDTFANADFRKERFDTAGGVVDAVGEGVAKGLQDQVDESFFSTAEAEASVNDFIGEVGGNIAIDKVAAGSETNTLSPERISEIADGEFRKHTLTKQRLDAAVKRGLLTANTATNLATLALKRAQNSSIGSLFSSNLRDIYAPLTGSPSTSPAVTFTKSAQEQQADLEQKLRVEKGAARQLKAEEYSRASGMTLPESKAHLQNLAAQALTVSEMEAKAVTRKLNDAEIMASIDAKIILVNEQWQANMGKVVDEQGRLLDPAQLRTQSADLRKGYDEIAAWAKDKELSDNTLLNQKIANNYEVRMTVLDLNNQGKFNAEELDNAKTISEGLAIATFPEAALLAKVAPQYVEELIDKGFSREQFRAEIKTLAGPKKGDLILSKIDQMAEYYRSLRFLGQKKPLGRDQVGEIIASVFQFSKEGRSDVFTMLDDVPQSSKWQAEIFRTTDSAPLSSLPAVIEEDMPALTGFEQKASAKGYTKMVNAKTTAISRETLDDPELDGHVFTITQEGSGATDRNWSVNFPDGYENEDFKSAVKDYARFMRDTPTYWSGYAGTWQEATLLGINDGRQVTPQELIAGVDAKAAKDAEIPSLAPGEGLVSNISDTIGNTVQSLSNAAATLNPITNVKGLIDVINTTGARAFHLEGQKILDSEGIEVFSGERTALEQLQSISGALGNGSLEATPAVMKSIGILGDEIKAEEAAKANAAAGTEPAVAGTPPVSKAQQAVNNLPPAQEGSTLVGNIGSGASNIDKGRTLPDVGVSSNTQGDRGPGTTLDPNPTTGDRPSVQNDNREAVGFNPKTLGDVDLETTFGRVLDNKQRDVLVNPVDQTAPDKPSGVSSNDRGITIDPKDVRGSIRTITMAEEHPDEYVSKKMLRDDGTVGSGKAMEGDVARPYMYPVEKVVVDNKGKPILKNGKKQTETFWEVDVGYGKLVKANMKTEAEALKVLKNTKPISKQDARDALDKELDGNTASMKKAFPGLDDAKVGVLAMMQYQGIDLRKEFPKSRALLKEAIKDPTDKNWRKVQEEMLDSDWAMNQTARRAIDTVLNFHPETGYLALASEWVTLKGENKLNEVFK